MYPDWLLGDHMAEELATRERRLVRHERMAAIGQLAAGVAHELNNPIGIIRGYLKTMSPEDDPEALREELGILDQEAAECQRIAEDLLSYARTSELALEPVQIKRFLNETVARFLSARDDESEIDLDASAATLSIDQARVRQVILNLLKNAVQMSEGSARIRIVAAVVSDCYRIDIADNGPGIPVEERGRIFEPFFCKRKGRSGLGLAVVSGIVRGHGGTIEVIDSPLGGALFRIELPLSGPPSSKVSLFPEANV